MARKILTEIANADAIEVEASVNVNVWGTPFNELTMVVRLVPVDVPPAEPDWLTAAGVDDTTCAAVYQGSVAISINAPVLTELAVTPAVPEFDASVKVNVSGVPLSEFTIVVSPSPAVPAAA